MVSPLWDGQTSSKSFRQNYVSKVHNMYTFGNYKCNKLKKERKKKTNMKYASIAYVDIAV